MKPGRDGQSQCIPSCWDMPTCTLCGRPKKPKGRDVGVAAANGYCDPDCGCYYSKPEPGHYWPEEEPELRAAVLKESGR